MLEAGDCYLIATNKDAEGYEAKHLFVILLDGEQFTGTTIVVPVNSYESEKQDQTTLLQPGEHEFIVKVSFTNYSRARATSIKDIQRLIDEKKATQKTRFNPQVLERMCEGVLRSKRTPNEVKQIYSHYLFRKLKKD
jgi:hypothetical protein